MKFLCGRPGCGKESTATLQIDAPSETVSLVDPRISRDGVPLCARHADATTPPMGWTMNDLRSHNRALAAVPDEGTIPTSTPPRVRPEGAPEGEASETGAGGTERPGQDRRGRRGSSSRKRMSRRQSIEERARQTADVDLTSDREPARTEDEDDIDVNEIATAETRGPGETAATGRAKGNTRSKAGGRRKAKPKGKTSQTQSEAPESRPTKRREVAEEVAVAEDEKFPWHHQYQDDEPEEMQASSPLLSRAFRSSTG